MRFLAPWLLTFVFGFLVFLIGLYFQRQENATKERREFEEKVRQVQEMHDLASVTDSIYKSPDADRLGQYASPEHQGKLGNYRH